MYPQLQLCIVSEYQKLHSDKAADKKDINPYPGMGDWSNRYAQNGYVEVQDNYVYNPFDNRNEYMGGVEMQKTSGNADRPLQDPYKSNVTK